MLNYYNIENTFTKLHRIPEPKIEVKLDENIIEIKRKKMEVAIPKGIPLESEREFLKMATSNKFLLSIGNKGTGKSFTLLHFLRLALDAGDWFDCYFLVLPMYNQEADDSYAFIKNYKNKKIYIYNEWDSDIILNQIMDRPADERKFIAVDDSTGHFNSYAYDPILTKFLATLRHWCATMYVITHTIRKSLPTAMRALIDGLLVYNTSSRMSLQVIYEEYLSILFNSFNEFLTFYKKNVLYSSPYNGLFINIRMNDKVYENINQWQFLKNTK
jgi:hypothetical protein